MLERSEIPRTQWDEVPNVPVLRGAAGTCGYTGLAMLLHHRGYKELTPRAIADHLHKDYNETTKNGSPKRPALARFSSSVAEFTEGEYRGRQRNKTLFDQVGLDPLEVLETYIRDHIPVMIRIPGHFVVVKGVSQDGERFLVNDPILGRKDMARFDLNRSWGNDEKDYPVADDPVDTRYLMLIIKRNT